MVKVQDTGVPSIGTFELDGREFEAAVRISFDGIEYVGRLWFSPTDDAGAAIPDRGAFPGRTTDEVIELARRLRPDELIRRYGRALSEKRRFLPLRVTTDEIIAKIRYINHVAVAARNGLLDPEGANQEMQLTQQQLQELVLQATKVAGVEV